MAECNNETMHCYTSLLLHFCKKIRAISQLSEYKITWQCAVLVTIAETNINMITPLPPPTSSPPLLPVAAPSPSPPPPPLPAPPPCNGMMEWHDGSMRVAFDSILLCKRGDSYSILVIADCCVFILHIFFFYRSFISFYSFSIGFIIITFSFPPFFKSTHRKRFRRLKILTFPMRLKYV